MQTKLPMASRKKVEYLKDRKEPRPRPRPRTPEAERSRPAESERAGIGREGCGVVGQNWVESLDAARKGRYAKENKVQGEPPDHVIDTDISQAV